MPVATSSASELPEAPFCRCAQPLRHAGQRQVRDHAPEQHQRGAAERLRALAREVEALQRRVDRQEAEQPDRQRQHDAQPGRRDAPDPRQPQHPQRDRDHADVDAEQRHQPEERQVVGRRLDRHRDLVRDRPAGRREQGDLVRLALDPRLLDPQHRRLQPADLALGAGELRERVVDHGLGDPHGVRPVVAHRELDHARLELRALDRELLDRHAAPLAEARPAEQREGGRAPPTISASGTSPSTHSGARHGHQLDLEETLPAELGELGLVGVEHELPGMGEAPLEDPALALAQHHRVGELGRGLAACPSGSS